MRISRRIPSSLFAAFLITSLGALGADEIPLTLAATGQHDLEITKPAADLWQLTATGNDPYLFTVPAAAPIELKRYPVLAFDYLSVTGVNDLQVFLDAPWTEQRSHHAGAVPPRQGWSPYSVDLGSTAAIKQLRLDLGSKAGAVIQLRNLRLRAYDQKELDAAAREAKRRDDDQRLDQALRAYSQRTYPSRIDRVEATAETIEISGMFAAGDAAGIALAEWPAWQPLTTPMRFADQQALSGGAFHASVPRLRDSQDRLLSRWVLVHRGPDGDELVSHARWVDAVPAATALPEEKPRSKKGLGGFHAGVLDSDLDDLGISAVTVNIALAPMLKAEATATTSDFVSAGRTWHLDNAAVGRLDATLLVAAQRHIVVLGILLIENAKHWASPELGRIFQHPDYQPPGIFSMPNMATAEGVAGYAAMMDFLVQRYGRADGKYGRVHHWIIGNEVDMGWEWTNCGARPELVFFDQYYKALRLAYLVARRQDPHARVYISLTQWWNRAGDPAHCHPSRALLDDLSTFSAAEGDFEWGVAYHPYPDSLFEPKAWLDRNTDFTLATPKITFRNIEVLDAWAKLPRNRYQGTTVRSIHLSEQGPNSKDYSEQALAEQAASMAYVWKKLSRLDSIEAFEYHNWIDNRGEGGLRIGLRRFRDDAEKPLGVKPVWEVYKALGTAGEDAACGFAKAIIGIKEWDEVVHQQAITAGP